MKQSFVVFPFCQNNIDAETLIRAAAKIGFQGIESSNEQHWKIAADHGLRVAGAAGHLPVEKGLSDRENQNYLVDTLSAKIETAQKFGIERLVCFSGNRDGRSDEEGIAACVDALKLVVPLAETKGVTILLELLNSSVDHNDYHADRMNWGLEVCTKVDSPNMKILYDIYHMQVMEGDLIRTIENHIDSIGHFHTGGNPGRGEIGPTQEIYYPAIVRAINKLNFRGYIGHEFVPKGDPIEALREAFEVCNYGD